MNTKNLRTGLTHKQEHFAQLVAAGATQSAAYKQAYDVSPDSQLTTITEAASRLAADSNVAAMIAQLKQSIQKQATGAAAWNLDRLVDAAEEHRETALEGGYKGVSAANGALELIGRATGLLADKPTAPSTAIQIVFVTAGESLPSSRVVSVVEGKLIDDKAALPTPADNDNRS